MLGWELVQAFERQRSFDLRPLSHAEMDITNLEQVHRMLKELHPSVVINAAAYTNVDGAESEREKAFAINATGPRNLALACEEAGTRLIHFSTDQVFDGSGNKPWSEEDLPHPLNYYAETKWVGEKEVLKSRRSLVLRVQWLYGARKDRFTILRNKDVFTPASDQFGAPTWTKDIADYLIRLIEKEARGLFHFSYDDYATWAEIFEFACRELHFATRLIPRKSEELQLAARRPKFCVLSNKKLLSFLGQNSLGSWKDSLHEFLSYSPARS